jgi:oxygen-dependent protoporphyrinogen oxidase
MTDGRRALVLGGGIAGLAAAVELGASLANGSFDGISLWEADERLGGKIRTSPFGGVERVDEGADAYLLRTSHARELANEVGLDDITHPTSATAAIWHAGLHDLPGGSVLGMPARLTPFARSSLLSWRGKLRAAFEPMVPTFDPDDSLGRLVRRRFGNEVHERLVDALVGSIYAADTDRWSLESVPQLAALARDHRSLLLAARSARRHADATPTGPVFGAPRAGMGALVTAAGDCARRAGVEISLGRPAIDLTNDGGRGWIVDGERFDAVVVATPAGVAARLLADVAADSAEAVRHIETADVVMVRLALSDWPTRLRGRSGYLVPKPDQRHVTAASFASQKWTHWQPPGGGQLLRVSLGRDGLPVMHLSDDEVIDATLRDLELHLGKEFQPTATSITRWPAAFPQYRPHHSVTVSRAEQHLPVGLALAGASYHGIGIPACIASGRRAARAIQESTSHADGFLT